MILTKSQYFLVIDVLDIIDHIEKNRRGRRRGLSSCIYNVNVSDQFPGHRWEV